MLMTARPARIFALLTDCYGSRGGIAQFNRDILSALSRAPEIGAIEALARLGGPHGESIPPKVTWHRPCRPRAMFAARAVDIALRRGPFDAVLCGHVRLAHLSALIARWLGCPVWLQVHGIDAWDRPNPRLAKAIERSSLITAVSRYTRRRILAWADVAPETVRVLPNTVRPSFTSPLAMHNGEVAPRHWPFSKRRFIITVSRIDKTDAYKGHHRVLDVLPDLARSYPDIAYVVAGDGDGRSALENQAQRLSIADRVFFLGHVADDIIRILLGEARALVMPSTKEGFGIAFLEAAAAGIPVIAGNVDGSTDALADGALGCLVDPYSPADLRDAIAAAIEGRIRPASPADVRRFEFDNFAGHVADVIGTLLRPSKPTR